jgi:nitrite reductase (NADH) small subunit/3-phenylpropionate/trans-cinnamate dioxygenase ferredoxin subunit
MAFIRAARSTDILPGVIREFQVGGTAVALANVEGKFFAINNVCMHRGGPLGEGELDRQIVTCPWHGWQFDVTSGHMVGNPAIATPCYAVEVRDGDIFVDVGEEKP